jgi:antitoxin MazE
MVGNIAKWGNSLAIKIPQHLAKIGLIDGAEVELVAIDLPVSKKVIHLKSYYQRICRFIA